MKEILRGSSSYEIFSATMVGQRRKFYISNRLKQLEKLNICMRQVMQIPIIVFIKELFRVSSENLHI